jgi:hypothetical protein
MPPVEAATKLREVELGLGALARELEKMLGVPPANLLWWREELRDVIFDLEDAPEARKP